MVRSGIAAVLVASFAVHAQAHDTFLTFDDYYLKPDSAATVSLINGTFTSSENNVALDRLRDARITGPDKRHETPEAGQWHLTETLNELSFKTGAAGTYGAGVSIKPRVLEMEAEDFNSYLEHDGVLDVLAARRADGQLDQPAAEKYSKHVKALFQVGDAHTSNYAQVYGYPIEIVPQANPFALAVGDTLPVTVLFKGKPVNDQLVFASYAGFEGDAERAHGAEAVQTRTDAKGTAQIPLTSRGNWYVRLIHMQPSDEDGVDYESNWATLTFAVR